MNASKRGARSLGRGLIAASIVLMATYMGLFAVTRDMLFLTLAPTTIGLLVPGIVLLARSARDADAE